jgi:hypothetical protein
VFWLGLLVGFGCGLIITNVAFFVFELEPKPRDPGPAPASEPSPDDDSPEIVLPVVEDVPPRRVREILAYIVEDGVAYAKAFSRPTVMEVGTRPEYEAIKEQLVAHGYLEPQGKRQSAVWTEDGKALLSSVYEDVDGV